MGEKNNEDRGAVPRTKVIRPGAGPDGMHGIRPNAQGVPPSDPPPRNRPAGGAGEGKPK